jgi:hypothetical protein
MNESRSQLVSLSAGVVAGTIPKPNWVRRACPFLRHECGIAGHCSLPKLAAGSLGVVACHVMIELRQRTAGAVKADITANSAVRAPGLRLSQQSLSPTFGRKILPPTSVSRNNKSKMTLVVPYILLHSCLIYSVTHQNGGNTFLRTAQSYITEVGTLHMLLGTTVLPLY